MEKIRQNDCMHVVYWMLENELTYKQALKENSKALKHFKQPFFTPTEEEKAWIIEEYKAS